MPPDGKLGDADIGVLSAGSRWAARGRRRPSAPRRPASTSPTSSGASGRSSRSRRRSRRPSRTPPGRGSPIDRFILARLEAKGLGRSRGRQAHADSPRDVRPDRPAADAGRDRRLPGGRFAATRSRRSSTGCWRRRPTANAGAGTGSTWPATPTRPARPPTIPVPRGLPLPQLRHRRLQPRQALRPVRPRADRRRPAARPDRRPAGSTPSWSPPPASWPSRRGSASTRRTTST